MISVPDPAWLRGDFSAVPGLALYDPATGSPDGTGRRQFAGNVIPQNRFTQIATKLLPYMPAPTSLGAYTSNFNTNVPFLYDGNSFDGRVDHNVTDSTKIFGKMNYSKYNVTQKAALGGFTINNDFRRNYGPSNYDRTHMLTISHVYQLPIGKRKAYVHSGPAAYILGNWQLNGIYRFATGTPFSITTDATPCNCPGNGNYANVLGPTSILGGIGPGQKWFDIRSSAAPPANTFGNAGRNIVRGPRLSNYDMSIFRIFPLTEKAKLEFRGEFYNLTNTPHFGSPSGSVTSGNFGEITGTLSGYGNREVQLALRLTF